MTLDKLKRVCSTLKNICYSTYEATLFQSIYLLAYYGLFRVGELVFTSHLQPKRSIQISDISFHKDDTAVSISIRMSKTKQYGRPIVLKIPCEKTASLCPVGAMRKFINIRPSHNEQLFCHKTPVTRSQFSAVLARSMHACGLGDN